MPEGQDQVRLTLAIAQLLSADPLPLCLEGRASIDGKEVVHHGSPGRGDDPGVLLQARGSCQRSDARPEDRARFREEAARAAKENKPFPPPETPLVPDADGNPERATGEDSRRRDCGGASRLGWSRNGRSRSS